MSKFIVSAKLSQLKEKFYKKSFLNNISRRGWLIILGFLICAIGLVYLAQINSLATRGFEIKDLEEKAAQLKDQNKQLELQISDLRSSTRVNEEIAKLKMEQVAYVEYLQANGSTVAINR